MSSIIPADLRYTESHEWARAGDDGIVVVGITDHAQHLLVFPERRCKEITRIAGGDADRVETPEAVFQGVEKIRTKGVVVANEAAR